MTIFILLWANFSYFGSTARSVSTGLLFYRLNWAAVSLFLPSFFYFFVIYFLLKSHLASKIGIIIFILSIIFFILSLFTGLIIKDVVQQSWGMGIVFGPLSDYFNIFSAIVAIIVITYSVQSYKSLSKEMKVKLNYFLAGIFVFITANLVFNVGLQVIFQSVRFQIYGDFSAIFFLVFTAYAIVKYELFDIKIIATEGLTAVLWIVLLAKTFVSESPVQLLINILIFLLTVIFGVLLIKSVTREVKQRQLLEELNKKLKELDKQKDEFVSMAAHELRSPLTAIKGYVSMIMEGDTGDIPEKARQYLADSMAVTDRLVRLVNNMLNVSRIEEGRIVYQMEETHLIRAVQEVYYSYRIEAERKGIEIVMNIPNGLDDVVYVDPDRIREVIGNIVSNAVKFTEKGKIEISIGNPRKGVVRVDVSDTGPGITEEEQKKLFVKFYRAESTAGKTFGTGLGLYITKLLIDNFGGVIGVESQIDKGTTFWFELPVRKQV